MIEDFVKLRHTVLLKSVVCILQNNPADNVKFSQNTNKTP